MIQFERALNDYLHQNFPNKKLRSVKEEGTAISQLVMDFCALQKIQPLRKFRIDYGREDRTGVLDFLIILNGIHYPIQIDKTNKPRSIEKLKGYSTTAGRVLPIWIRWNTPVGAMDLAPCVLIDLSIYKHNIFRPDISSEISSRKRYQLKLFSHEDFFHFGKYKGQKIEDVFRNNPLYVAWCIENIFIFKLFPQSLVYLQESGEFKFSQATVEINTNAFEE